MQIALVCLFVTNFLLLGWVYLAEQHAKRLDESIALLQWSAQVNANAIIQIARALDPETMKEAEAEADRVYASNWRWGQPGDVKTEKKS